MNEFRDGLEDAAEKLQEGVDRAIAGAKSAFEKAKPYLEDGIDMVKDGAQNLYDHVKPAFENLAERVESAKEETKQPDFEEKIAQEVDEQMNKIRESSVTPTPFTEYIRQTYGKKDNKQ